MDWKGRTERKLGMDDFSRRTQGSNATCLIGDLCELFDVILDLEFDSFLLPGGDAIPDWSFEYCDAWDSFENVKPGFR